MSRYICIEAVWDKDRKIDIEIGDIFELIKTEKGKLFISGGDLERAVEIKPESLDRYLEKIVE